MSTLMEDDIKRWTAKRKTALVLDIIQGKTTISEASRAFDLSPSDVEQWVDEGRRASRWLSPQSCSLWLNILAVKRCRNDRVALWIERDGGDGRPVAGST